MDDGALAVASLGDHPGKGSLVHALETTNSSRRLLVLPYRAGQEGMRGMPFILRRDRGNLYPTLLGVDGCVCVPLNGGWVGCRSPSVARVLSRVGFSHLADGEPDPAEQKRFYCPWCPTGYLSIEQVSGEGWSLVCTRRPSCQYRRRLSLEEAKLKVRSLGKTCDHGHPLTVRSGASGGLFLGCENYPDCTFTESLAIIRGL